MPKHKSPANGGRAGGPQRRRASRNPQLARVKRIKLFLAAWLVLVTGAMFFVGYFTLQAYVAKWKIPPLNLSLSSSKYLSANEDEDIRFGVENSDGHKIDVEFRLENKGPLVSNIGLEGNNAFYLGQVQSQEQINRQLKVYFPCSVEGAFTTLGSESGLSLWGKASANDIYKIADLPIMIAPIPWARTIRTPLFLTWVGLLGWLVKEIWWGEAKEGAKQKA